MKIIILILSLLFSLSTFAQNPKCKKFKEGEFTYFDPSMSNHEVEMSRKGTVQTEYNSELNATVISKVIWKSDCVYELIYEKFEGYPFSMEDSIGKGVVCRILETDGNSSYKVHAKAEPTDPGRIITIRRKESNSPKP